MAAGELSTIKQFKTDKLAEYHWAHILKVFNSDNAAIIQPEFFDISFKEVTIAPGTYHFVFMCSDGASSSQPEITEIIEAGIGYTMYCERIIKKKGLFGLDMITGTRAKIIKSSDFSPSIIKDSYYE